MADFTISEQDQNTLGQLEMYIGQWATELGFTDYGISDLNLKDAAEKQQAWIDNGYHADMQWIPDRVDMRTQPSLLSEGAQRAICVRMDYLPPDTQPLHILTSPEKAYVSRYSLGRDYHKLIRKRLSQLSQKIEQWLSEQQWDSPICQRGFVDSAPVMERPLAEKAGIGWQGKHTLIINPHAGSWFFLGEILTNLPLTPNTSKVDNQCGQCKACLTICPTDAFPAPYQLNANKCISYLTIENQGEIPVELRKKMGNRVFGCDDCQLVCPWNRFAKYTAETDFTPRHQLDNSDLIDLFNWDEQQFLDRTAGSPIRRVGFNNWQRNLAVGLGNTDKKTASAAINALINNQNSNTIVQEHKHWAIAQLGETIHRVTSQDVTQTTARLKKLRKIEK